MHSLRCVALCVAVGFVAGSPALSQFGCDAETPQMFTEVPLTGIDPVYGARFLNNAGEVAGDMPGGVVYVWKDGAVVTRTFEGMVATVVGLSENGLVAGIVRAPSSNDSQVFVWDSRAGGVELFSPAGGLFPSGINFRGELCGIDGEGLLGVVFDPSDELSQPITFVGPPAMNVGTPGALALSDDGVVVGSEVVFDDVAGFYVEIPYLWTAEEGIVELPVIEPLLGGRANAINDAGVMAGVSKDAFSGNQPCVWRDGGETLDVLGTPFGYFIADVTAMNNREQFAVVAPNDLFGFNRAFVFENGNYVHLTQPSMCARGLYAWRPLDINDHGEILVQLGTFNGPTIEDVVILRPIATCAGDCFTTGDVDFADLISILFVLGEDHADERCDADGDGVVAFNDLVSALFAFGGCE